MSTSRWLGSGRLIGRRPQRQAHSHQIDRVDAPLVIDARLLQVVEQPGLDGPQAARRLMGQGHQASRQAGRSASAMSSAALQPGDEAMDVVAQGGGGRWARSRGARSSARARRRPPRPGCPPPPPAPARAIQRRYFRSDRDRRKPARPTLAASAAVALRPPLAASCLPQRRRARRSSGSAPRQPRSRKSLLAVDVLAPATRSTSANDSIAGNNSQQARSEIAKLEVHGRELDVRLPRRRTAAAGTAPAAARCGSRRTRPARASIRCADCCPPKRPPRGTPEVPMHPGVEEQPPAAQQDLPPPVSARSSEPGRSSRITRGGSGSSGRRPNSSRSAISATPPPNHVTLAVRDAKTEAGQRGVDGITRRSTRGSTSRAAGSTWPSAASRSLMAIGATPFCAAGFRRPGPVLPTAILFPTSLRRQP